MRRADKLTILIVDDQWLIRLALRQVISHEFRDVVFGEAQTAVEALAQIKKQPWRLVILDLSLSGQDDGFSVLREVCARHPEVAVLVLGIYFDSEHAARALQLGAAGYISKNSGRPDFLKAVSSVLGGKKHFTETTRQGAPSLGFAALHPDLSSQEYKVLLSLAAGSRTGEIAAEMNLSAKTVSTYRRRVLNKLRIESTADLVRYVIDHKLS